jgi:hypothetical protein
MLKETSNARLAKVHPELARRVRHLDSSLPWLRPQVVLGLNGGGSETGLWAIGWSVAEQPRNHAGILRPVGDCPEHPFGLVEEASCRGDVVRFGGGRGVANIPR